MTDLPRRAVTRTAKLATLPLGLAGRTALGVGKRVGGRPSEVVIAEVQQRTAEQMFRVLGELKDSEHLLGRALLNLSDDDFAGPSADPLANTEGRASSKPEGKRGELGSTRHSSPRQVGHLCIVDYDGDMANRG